MRGGVRARGALEEYHMGYVRIGVLVKVEPPMMVQGARAKRVTEEA